MPLSLSLVAVRSIDTLLSTFNVVIELVEVGIISCFAQNLPKLSKPHQIPALDNASNTFLVVSIFVLV